MPRQLLRQLERHARHRGDAAAIAAYANGNAAPGMTWAQLHRATLAWPPRLDATLPPDAVVLLIGRNRPAYAAAALGVLAAGRTLFPVDASLTAAELAALVEQADVAAAIVGPDVSPALPSYLTRFDLPDPLDPSSRGVPAARPHASPDPHTHHGTLLLQSSGSTGGPKIVRRSGPSLDAVARNVAHATGLTPADRVLAAVPLSHSYGLENGLLAPVFAGAAMIHHITPSGSPPRGFDPDLIGQSIATVLPGVPALFDIIDRTQSAPGTQTSPGRLRLAYSAGAPLPADLAQRLEQRGGLRLGSLYGSTEVGSVTFGQGPATVGYPMQGVDLRILDPATPDPDRPLPPGEEGHVAVRAPSMFDGYLTPLHPDDHEPAPVVGGFFLTGDLGRLSADGELTLTGRLKLLIDVGGVKVNPLEVERALADHPAVAECVVLPDPVSPTVTRVRAILTTLHDPPPTRDELRRFLRPRLAPHKIPRTFDIVPSLPRSPTGKVLRRQLQETA